MSRHTETVEQKAAVFDFCVEELKESHLEIAQSFLFRNAPLYSKWLTEECRSDYRSAYMSGYLNAANKLVEDFHTRQCVIQGPPGACWLGTQILSNDESANQYTIIGFYRSLDVDHSLQDAALQFIMGERILHYIKVASMGWPMISNVILMAGSSHVYKREGIEEVPATYENLEKLFTGA